MNLNHPSTNRPSRFFEPIPLPSLPGVVGGQITFSGQYASYLSDNVPGNVPLAAYSVTMNDGTSIPFANIAFIYFLFWDGTSGVAPLMVPL